MWLALPDSVISTVAARDLTRRPDQPTIPNLLVVRARLRAHLAVLLNRHPELLTGVEIIDGGGSDYRFRFVVARDIWAEVVRREVMSISYTNFKDEAANRCGSGSAYVGALHSIWGILRRLQDQGARP